MPGIAQNSLRGLAPAVPTTSAAVETDQDSLAGSAVIKPHSSKQAITSAIAPTAEAERNRRLSRRALTGIMGPSKPNSRSTQASVPELRQQCCNGAAPGLQDFAVHGANRQP